uniref:SCP domain-containing protein n=1 Tax=Plectus sambesii TaxID=2011161 RepID=A0A914XNU8_9BILA
MATTTTTLATTTTTMATTTTAITTTSTAITTTTACPVQSTAADEQAMVDYINNLRSKLAKGTLTDKTNVTMMAASDNMRKMQWNSSLAAESQAWACACVYAHSPPSRNAGENLFAQYGYPMDITSNFERAAQKWWDELVQYWVYRADNIFDGSIMAAGHFTQLAWAKTYQVGCGFAQCPNTIFPGYNAGYVVCRFLEIGNYINQEIYHPSLVPCTANVQCLATLPAVTICDADGLCA